MPIIPFIYFTILTFILWYRNKLFDLAVGIAFIFALSSFFGVLIDIYDLYGDFGILQKVESPIATIVYCVGITIVIFPFTKIKTTSIENIELKKPKLFNIFSYIIFFSSIIYMFSYRQNFSQMIVSLQSDAATVKADYYSDLEFGNNVKTASYMYPINIIVGLGSLILSMWFYSITFLKKSLIFNLLLLLSSLSGVIREMSIAGRTSLIYWLLSFFFLFLFFRSFMDSKARKQIYIVFILLGVLITTYFVIVTISRFGDRMEGGGSLSFIGYAGQMYNNFCVFFDKATNLPIDIERIFPIINKYVLGHNFDLLAYYDKIYTLSGVPVNCFATILGGLYINIGLIGMLVYLSIYLIFSNSILSNFSHEIDFSYIILLSVLILVPVRGLFGLPFNSPGDSLIIISSICLFLLFKYSIKK